MKASWCIRIYVQLVKQKYKKNIISLLTVDVCVRLTFSQFVEGWIVDNHYHELVIGNFSPEFCDRYNF